jgi:hypothetical protein
MIEQGSSESDVIDRDAWDALPGFLVTLDGRCGAKKKRTEKE